MSIETEEHLRQRLHTEVAELDLAPGAVSAVMTEGRRRGRRRRAVVGGAAALAVAAGAMAVATGWGRGLDGAPEVVATNEQTPPVSDAPQMITRSAGEQPGPGGRIILVGTMIVTGENCIAMAGDEQPVVIVWPHGWSAGRQNGTAVVYDAGGEVFAREGGELGLPGSGAQVSKYAGKPCATDNMFETSTDLAAPPTTDP